MYQGLARGVPGTEQGRQGLLHDDQRAHRQQVAGTKLAQLSFGREDGKEMLAIKVPLLGADPRPASASSWDPTPRPISTPPVRRSAAFAFVPVDDKLRADAFRGCELAVGCRRDGVHLAERQERGATDVDTRLCGSVEGPQHYRSKAPFLVAEIVVMMPICDTVFLPPRLRGDSCTRATGRLRLREDTATIQQPAKPVESNQVDEDRFGGWDVRCYPGRVACALRYVGSDRLQEGRPARRRAFRWSTCPSQDRISQCSSSCRSAWIWRKVRSSWPAPTRLADAAVSIIATASAAISALATR